MSLRRIQAIAVPGLKIEEITSAPPTLEWVSPSELLVDETYQRSLRERSINLIRRIIARWDWRRFKPPIVVKTEHGYEVVDGQHTSMAAVSRGIEKIPVLVVDAAEMKDRAAAFIGHNRDRLVITTTQMFFAALAASDLDAVATQRACEEAGVRILKYQRPTYKIGETVTVSAITALVKAHGHAKAVSVLKALVTGKVGPIEMPHIKAAEALICWPKYELPPEDVATAVLMVGPDAKSLAKERSVMRKTKIYQALIELWLEEVPGGRNRAA